jgi:Na+-driven multidrug efflux pump
MRSIERVVISTCVYLASLIVDVILNWILIFGVGGAPELGIRGAAIATLCARIVEMLIVLWYAYFRNYIVRIRLRDVFHMDRQLFRDYMKYALPVVLNEVLWGMGSSANTAIIGHLGSAAVAANSVAQMAKQLATVVAFGVSHATAIYLGKTIGEKKLEEAKAYAIRFIGICILMGTIGAVIILLSIPAANANLTLSAEAQKYLTFMFIIMAYFTIAQSYNTTMVIGVFRAGGDTRFGLIMDVATMWGGSILIGALAAFVFHARVEVVYAILMCDELIKVPITTWRYRKYKWLNDVTHE